MTTTGPGRVWLISGSSAGFGREFVRAALAVGDRVMATARRPETLEPLAASAGGRVATAALDVTDTDSVQHAVDATLEAFGRIDVLVNNAGHGSVGAVEELTMAELREVMEVMFFGAVDLTKAVLPHMRRQESGTIVQMSSQGGQLTMPGFGAYCAAKYALEAISEALAAEVEPFGIRVLIVEPGAFRTEFGGARMHRSRRIDAYEVSTAATRAAVDTMDGTQPGDPAKAVQAVLEVLDTDDPPIRLALGNDAYENIDAHQQDLRKELHQWRRLSTATDLDQR